MQHADNEEDDEEDDLPVRILRDFTCYDRTSSTFIEFNHAINLKSLGISGLAVPLVEDSDDSDSDDDDLEHAQRVSLGRIQESWFDLKFTDP